MLLSLSLGIRSYFKRSSFYCHNYRFEGKQLSKLFETMNTSLKALIFSVFSLTRSHHHLPSLVPLGHHLHPGSDQQEVTEHSHQPSLPHSSSDVHMLYLRKTKNLWRQKDFILSQAELGQHASQRSGSACNRHYLGPPKWLWL